MGLRLLALLASTAVLAGCVDHAARPPQHPPSPSLDLSLPANATDCERVFTALFVPKPRAQELLPPGFHAADAGRFFGREALATGDGVILASIAMCSTSELVDGAYAEASIGVYVDAPVVADTEPVHSNVYEIARATPPNAMTARLAAVGWAAVAADITTSFTASPLASAQGEVSDEAGPWLALGTDTVFAPEDSDQHVRWWHQNDQGIGWFEYAFNPHGLLGPGECSFRPGTLLHTVMASSSCPGALFMVGPPFDWAGSFAFRAGLRAAA